MIPERKRGDTMKKFATVSVLTFLGALLLVACNTAASSSNNQVATLPVGAASVLVAAKIKPGLAATMTALAGSKTKQGFFVKLSEQAKFDDRPASMSQNDYANIQMEEVAKRTQPSVALVIKQLIQRGEAARYVAYVIVNGFYVVGSAEAIRVLSELPEVEYLEEDGTLRQPLQQRSTPVSTATPQPQSNSGNAQQPAAVVAPAQQPTPQR